MTEPRDPRSGKADRQDHVTGSSPRDGEVVASGSSDTERIPPANGPRDAYNTRRLPATIEQSPPRQRRKLPVFWQVVIVLLLVIVILVLALFLFRPPALSSGPSGTSTATTSPTTTSSPPPGTPRTTTPSLTTSAPTTTGSATTSGVSNLPTFTTAPFQIGLSGVVLENPPTPGTGVKWDVKYDPFYTASQSLLGSQALMGRWPGAGQPTLTDCAGFLASHGTTQIFSPNPNDQICVTRGSGVGLLTVQKVEQNDIVVVMTGQ